MKRRIVQETVKKQSKNKTENENSQEYFTMNSFMSKVHSKEEFENQPIPEKCINSTDSMVETIDEFIESHPELVKKLNDLGVKKEKVSECIKVVQSYQKRTLRNNLKPNQNGTIIEQPLQNKDDTGEVSIQSSFHFEKDYNLPFILENNNTNINDIEVEPIKFNNLPLMPELDEKEDPDYSPKKKNDEECDLIAHFFPGYNKASFASSKKVPFSSATFPEEDKDPDYDPFEDEPLSPYSLTQSYSDFVQTTCTRNFIEDSQDYSEMVPFLSAMFPDDEDNDSDYDPCASKKKKYEPEKNTNGFGIFDEPLSSSLTQSFSDLGQTTCAANFIEENQDDLKIKTCFSKPETTDVDNKFNDSSDLMIFNSNNVLSLEQTSEYPTFKRNFENRSENVNTLNKSRKVKFRLSDMRKDKLNDDSIADNCSFQPDFSARKNTTVCSNNVMTPDQLEILKMQIAQHVQLYSQTYLMTKNLAELQNENSESAFMLEELKMFKNSVLHPATLDEAIEITKRELDTNIVLQSYQKKTKNTYPLQICKTIASSSVFQFSQLLPRYFPSHLKRIKTRKNKPVMTDHEDRLLALQLYKYKKEKLPWSKYEMIQKFLMPCRSAEELKKRVDNCRDKKLNDRNPILEVIKLNIQPLTPPMLQSDLSSVEPEDVCFMPRVYEPEWLFLLRNHLKENKSNKKSRSQSKTMKKSNKTFINDEQKTPACCFNEDKFKQTEAICKIENEDISYICQFSKVYVKQLCDFEIENRNKKSAKNKVVDWRKTLSDMSVVPKRQIKLQFLEELQSVSVIHYLGFFPYLIKCQQAYQKTDVSKKIKQLIELLGCVIRSSNKEKIDIQISLLEEFYSQVQHLMVTNLKTEKLIKTNTTVLGHLEKFFLEQKTLVSSC